MIFLKKSYETSLEEKVCALGSQQKLNLGIGKVKLAGGGPHFSKENPLRKIFTCAKKEYKCIHMWQNESKEK